MANLELIWVKEYEVGIDIVDNQHHYFFDLIKRISQEFQDTKSFNMRSDLIKELNAYAKFHFVSEENLMKKFQYPGLADHIHKHLLLLDALSAKENMMALGKDSDSDDIVAFLVEWFLSHSTGEDKAFAEYLNGRGLSA